MNQSENWDKVYKTGKAFALIPEELVGAILEYAKELRNGEPIHTMIDLGCGVGDALIKFSQRGVQATGVDFSSTALSMLEEETKKHNYSIKFINKNLETITAEDFDRRFDLALNKLTLAFIKNKERFIKTAYDILAPNGIFVLMTPVFRDNQSEHVHNISVSQPETEAILIKVFENIKLFQERAFKDNGLEITYICQKKG